MTATSPAPIRARVEGADRPAPEPDDVSRPSWMQVVVVAAAVGVVAAGYVSLFADESVVLLLVGAALAPFAVAGLAHAKPRPLWVTVAASGVAWLVYTVLGVLVDTLSDGLVPSRDTWTTLGDGVFEGWAAILDALLPIGDDLEPRVFVVTLCWLAGLVTAEIVLRTRSVAAPMLPAIVLGAVLLPLRQPLGEPDALIVVVGTAAILTIPLARATPELVLRQRREDRSRLATFHSHGRLSSRLSIGLPIAAVIAVAAVAASDTLSFGRDDDPYDPREMRDERTDDTRTVNPLAQLKSVVLQDPPQPALAVEFANPDDALTVERIGLVRLDAYDGAQWSSTARYDRSDGDLDVERSTSEGAITVTAEITLQDTIGPWIPVPGRAEQISLDTVRYDEGTGNLIPFGADATRYQVQSIVVRPTDEEQLNAAPAADPEALELATLEVPLPAELSEVVAEASAEATTPYEQLEGISDWLRENVVHDPQSPSGHSYARLVDLVAGDRRGFSEQYASAFAVMARSLGFPARVVVGYRLIEADDAGEVVLVDEVTSQDLHAWAEVKLDGLGWVPFDPTPLTVGEAAEEPEEAPQGPGTTIAEGEVVGDQPEQAPRESGPTEREIPDEPEGFARILALVAAIAASVVLLVLLAAMAVLSAKRRRRRRRATAPTVEDRILGAWEEVLDRLAEAGLAVRRSMTLSEVGQAAAEHLSRPAVTPVVALIPDVRRTLYAPQIPGEATADQAWERVREFEGSLRAEQGRLRSLWGRLDPRTLRRR